MKVTVQETTAKGAFGESHPIDLVLEGQHLRIGQTHEEAYRLCVDILSWLHNKGQVEGYQIRTKAGSELNEAVTKNW